MNKFNCFDVIVVKPYVGVCLYSLIREMKSLSSKTGLPVKAKINDEEITVTALSNVHQTVESLQKNK